jgi:hypothetical protein
MSDRHRSWSRREFVERMGIVAAVGLLRRPVNATVEPPLETTRLRLPHLSTARTLRLREAGMIKSTPQRLIAEGTDWRFLNELKKELKG